MFHIKITIGGKPFQTPPQKRVSQSINGVITDYVPGTISLAIFLSLDAGVSSPQMKRWGYLGSSFCPLPHEVFGKLLPIHIVSVSRKI